MGMLLFGMVQAVVPAYADGGSNSGSGSDGGSGSSGSGSGNSGSGSDDSDNSGSGSGSGDDDTEGDDDWENATKAAERGDILPLQSVLSIALSNTPGKVIGVKLDHRGSSYVYHVKILSNTGRKVELSIDAQSKALARVK
jgi:hypothetical protein